MKCAFCGKEFSSDKKIRKYCSVTCRRRSNNLDRKYHTNESKTAVCKICGKQFTQRIGTECYCSMECRMEANRRRNRTHVQAKSPLKCAVCGKVFQPYYGHEKYCSEDCRIIGYKKSLQVNRAKKNARDVLDKQLKRPTKTIDDWAREAFACGLDYGTYRAMIERGKTLEELKAKKHP